MSTDAINAYVTIHQESWFNELSSQTAYNGLKITKKVSGLPVGMIVEFLSSDNDIELYVKFDSKKAYGASKEVSFPESPRGTIAFSVLQKTERKKHGAIKHFRREGIAYALLSESAHVLKGKRIKYKKWQSPDQEIRYGLRTEYMNRGSLDDALKQGMRFSEKEIKQIATAVAAGVGEIHTVPEVWAHCDLKPDNILLDEKSNRTLTVKIADLESVAKNSTSHSSWGTPLYKSPESFFNLPIGSLLKDDIWALGLTFQRLLFRKRPEAFAGLHTLEQLGSVLKSPQKIRGKQPPTKTFRHLIWQMLHPKPELRPTIQKVQKILTSLPESAFTTH